MIQSLVIYAHVSLTHVVLKTLGWLDDDLSTVLDDSDWELVTRHRGKPHSERTVVVMLNLVDKALESWQERWGQMTVLKDDPVTFFVRLPNSVDSFLTLTLTKRQRLKQDVSTDLPLQVLNFSHGISTGGKDNDDGLRVDGVSMDFLQVERGRTDVLLPNFLNDQVGDHVHDLVGAQDPDDYDLLKEV